MKKGIFWTVFWISLSMIFGIFVYWNRGPDLALDFLTAYVIEKSLSIDNIFVFVLIFKSFHMSERAQHRILFWGFFGALVMRALFIFAGVALITKFQWITYVFGSFLILAGLRMIPNKEKSVDVEKNLTLRILKKIMPFTNKSKGEKFFVRENGKIFATPLLAVLVMVEVTDLIFATDSIPAVLAITPDPFIVYTSNIFAILGLRSLYFVIGGALVKFPYLHYGIATILVFVGAKMLVAEHYPISTAASLGFIVIAVFLSLVLSRFYSVTPKPGRRR